MSSTPTKIEHQWVAFTMAAVIPVIDPETKEMVFLDDPNAGEAVTTYGCRACNMGVAEGMQNQCPGFDLFDEDTEP